MLLYGRLIRRGEVAKVTLQRLPGVLPHVLGESVLLPGYEESEKSGATMKSVVMEILFSYRRLSDLTQNNENHSQNSTSYKFPPNIRCAAAFSAKENVKKIVRQHLTVKVT